MAQERKGIHLIAGGIGGTVGAVITCPLEVVKTRLQSSVSNFGLPPGETYTRKYYNQSCQPKCQYSTGPTCTAIQVSPQTVTAQSKPTTNLYFCIKHIIKYEGPQGLFKGLGPNLIGVAPSRAIYFFAYASTKQYLNSKITPETPAVHILSALCAGITSSTLTNPIWFIKTRLQLDQKRSGGLNTRQCIQTIYRESGIKGFYKGITASYIGVTETVIHFVIYEGIKAKLREMKGTSLYDDQKSMFDFVEFMLAGAFSKTVATCVAYPHEVVRTRLRQEGNKYRNFVQTFRLVAKEEGTLALYRGLVTQLVRQIPNTAIMMSTYEAVVYLLNKYY